MRITRDGHFKQRPSFSSDGKFVVFARHQGATIHHLVRNLKTGDEERLTEGAAPEFDAVFAPRGDALLFSFVKQTPGQGDIEIHRLSLADRKPAPTAAVSQGGLSHEEWPAWSPDGKRFAFHSTRHGNGELYTAGIDGGEWTRLTNDPALDTHPAWSPDGKTIAFCTSRWGDQEIALIDVESRNVRRVTDSPRLDDYPAWSPDGRQLAFVSNRDGNLDIYVQRFDEDGTVQGPPTNVTRHEALDNFPAWTPDGRLAFVSNREDEFDLYLMPRP